MEEIKISVLKALITIFVFEMILAFFIPYLGFSGTAPQIPIAEDIGAFSYFSNFINTFLSMQVGQIQGIPDIINYFFKILTGIIGIIIIIYIRKG